MLGLDPKTGRMLFHRGAAMARAAAPEQTAGLSDLQVASGTYRSGGWWMFEGIPVFRRGQGLGRVFKHAAESAWKVATSKYVAFGVGVALPFVAPWWGTLAVTAGTYGTASLLGSAGIAPQLAQRLRAFNIGATIGGLVATGAWLYAHGSPLAPAGPIWNTLFGPMQLPAFLVW